MINVFAVVGFVLDAISGYIRTKSYVIEDMEQRETEIRTEAEKIVNDTLSLPKRLIFNWLLFHARRGKYTLQAITVGQVINAHLNKCVLSKTCI